MEIIISFAVGLALGYFGHKHGWFAKLKDMITGKKPPVE